MKHSSGLLLKLEDLMRRLLAFWLDDADIEPPNEIDRLIEQAQAELERIRDQVTAIIVQERDLRQQRDATAALAQVCDAQAEQALRAGHEAEARLALLQKISHIRDLHHLETELFQQHQAIADLNAQIGEIRQRIQAARRQRELLDIRRQRTETGQQAHQARRRGALRQLDATLERASAWSAARQDALQAARELEHQSPEAQLSQARRETDLEAELTALRARLAADTPPVGE